MRTTGVRGPRRFAILNGMQLSRALRALPVAFCLTPVPTLVRPLNAQIRYRVTSDAWLYQEAGTRRIAHVLRGAVVAGGDTSGDWRAVTLDGWIFEQSVGPASRRGFDLAVTRAPEENLREAPAGALVAKLPLGFFLVKVGAQRRWVHVQRSGWMQAAALTPLAAVASAGTAAPDSQAPAPP